MTNSVKLKTSKKLIKSISYACLIGTCFSFVATPNHVEAASEKPTFIFATTEDPGKRVRNVGLKLPEKDPGYFVEVARKATENCGNSVEFRFMNWARVLKSVKAGRISAGFNSSFKPERAEYGAYPMKDGKPDETRAGKFYAYHLYARKDDAEAIANWKEMLDGVSVGVEKSASIISELEKYNADLYERTDYQNLLTMLAKNRFRLAVGIQDNFDTVLEDNPDLNQKVVRVDPPVQKRVGYVMFNKEFYNQNTELVECFWDEAAKLKKTDWYKERIKYYDANY